MTYRYILVYCVSLLTLCLTLVDCSIEERSPLHSPLWSAVCTSPGGCIGNKSPNHVGSNKLRFARCLRFFTVNRRKITLRPSRTSKNSTVDKRVVSVPKKSPYTTPVVKELTTTITTKPDSVATTAAATTTAEVATTVSVATTSVVVPTVSVTTTLPTTTAAVTPMISAATSVSVAATTSVSVAATNVSVAAPTLKSINPSATAAAGATSALLATTGPGAALTTAPVGITTTVTSALTIPTPEASTTTVASGDASLIKLVSRLVDSKPQTPIKTESVDSLLSQNGDLLPTFLRLANIWLHQRIITPTNTTTATEAATTTSTTTTTTTVITSTQLSKTTGPFTTGIVEVGSPSEDEFTDER